MRIRVDEKSLVSQLEKSGCSSRLELPYHKMIKEGKLPYTIGGGLGKSRLLMLLLDKDHIAEVQASSWEDKTLTSLKSKMVL
jgi:aspartate--ammonia ligase